MEYVDGEGTAAAREAIGAHLVTCAACRAIAAEQRDLSETARAWTVDAPPSSLRPPAAPVARGLLTRAGKWRPSRVVLAGLSAAAVVLFVVSVPMREQRALAPVAPARAISASESAPRRAVAEERGGAAGGESRRRPNSDSVVAGVSQSVAPRTPAVIRTATLRIVVKEFDGVRTTVEGIVSQADGFIDHMTVTGDTTTARTLRGVVRVPGDRMAAALARLRADRPGRRRHAGLPGRHRPHRRPGRPPGQRPRDRAAPEGAAPDANRQAVGRARGRARAHARAPGHRTAGRGEDQRRPPRQLRDDRHHDLRRAQGGPGSRPAAAHDPHPHRRRRRPRVRARERRR